MKPLFPPRRPALALCAAACMLAGCTVGPDYRGAPAAPDTPTFVRAPATGIDPGAPAPSAWWHALHDRRLDALIAAALAHNPDLHAAQARLRAARAQLAQQRAAELPKTSATVAAIRMREPDVSTLGALLPSNGSGQSGSAPATLGTGPLQLYSAGFDATWEIDLFGGTRRAIE
ncbi:TolC family protein, partial [Burkholderia multivorans]|nr:TolC family protein [Burkholderia multivorans]